MGLRLATLLIAVFAVVSLVAEETRDTTTKPGGAGEGPRPIIGAYTFGQLVLDGRAVKSDLIILPDGKVTESWRTKERHVLALDDIKALVDSHPEVIVVGTGQSGKMKPADGLAEALKKSGITVEFLPTAKALKRFDALRQADKSVGGCFHLTC